MGSSCASMIATVAVEVALDGDVVGLGEVGRTEARGGRVRLDERLHVGATLGEADVGVLEAGLRGVAVGVDGRVDRVDAEIFARAVGGVARGGRGAGHHRGGGGGPDEGENGAERDLDRAVHGGPRRCESVCRLRRRTSCPGVGIPRQRIAIKKKVKFAERITFRFQPMKKRQGAYTNPCRQGVQLYSAVDPADYRVRHRSAQIDAIWTLFRTFVDLKPQDLGATTTCSRSVARRLASAAASTSRFISVSHALTRSCSTSSSFT